MQLNAVQRSRFEHALGSINQRPTRQREHIFSIILGKRDHPTADEIFARARAGMASISLATVYNCLDTLVEAGLVRQVNFERDSTRYCPNLHQHAHFHCRDSGIVHDIELPSETVEELRRLLPAGYAAERIELSYTGHIAERNPADAGTV